MTIKPQTNVKLKYSVPQFKGLILAAFDPFLKDYASAEESTLKNQICGFQPANKIETQGN